MNASGTPQRESHSLDTLPSDQPEVVDESVPCLRCGRDLKGCGKDSHCPDCGLAVATSLQPQLAGKLGRLPLHRQVLALAIWPFMEQVLNFLVGFVDTMLAGRMDPVAVAATEAMAIGAYVSWGVSLVMISVGVGASAIIARAVGGRHRRVANAALGQALVMATVLGGVIAAAMYYAAEPISAVMGTVDQEIDGVMQPALSFSTVYLQIVCAAAPLSGVLFVGSACLRAAGDTRSPFIVLTIVNIVNTAVSALLVYGPEPIGGHGVRGIAYGTAIAWAVGSLLIVIVLIKGWGGIRLRWMRLKPHWHTMVRIVRVALPNLIESFTFWFGNFLVVSFVGQIGQGQQAGALAAHVIGIRLEAISYLPGFALGIAASTLTGQYLGLGDPHRAKRAAMFCWLIGVVVMGLMGLVFWFFPVAMTRLVTDEPRLLELAPPLLMICAPVQVFFATAMVFSNAMRGAGATRSTLIVSAFSTWCVRVPTAYYVGVHLGYGIWGLWFVLCGELVLRGTLFGIQFARGKWATVKV